MKRYRSTTETRSPAQRGLFFCRTSRLTTTNGPSSNSTSSMAFTDYSPNVTHKLQQGTLPNSRKVMETGP